MQDDFVNLHLHSMFSLQDSVIKFDDLVEILKKYKQISCAITDHASTAGWVIFDQVMRENNLKPIFGNEFYCIESYNLPKTKRRDHLVLLAMNDEGVVNIQRMQNVSVQHFYYRPILDYNTLKNNIDGLYCTSACSLGTISKYILDKKYDKAEDYALKFDDWFNGNFSLELQFHPDYPDQKIINEYLVQISEKYNIPLTVSCDSHFIDEENKEVRKAIQAAAWHKNINEINDSLSSNCVGNSEIILENAKISGFEHIDLVNKAINQTKIISDLCNASLSEKNRKIPKFNKRAELNEMFNKVGNW